MSLRGHRVDLPFLRLSVLGDTGRAHCPGQVLGHQDPGRPVGPAARTGRGAQLMEEGSLIPHGDHGTPPPGGVFLEEG